MPNEKVNSADISQLQQLPATNAPPSMAITNAEIGATYAAAQAKADVESRYVIAYKRPRDWDAVRRHIIDECARPSFARNKSAYYVKPIGDGAEGLGIRFAEVALRHMTNVLIESPMIYEDSEREVHQVTLTDLESNVTYKSFVRVSKYVERARVAVGQQWTSVRKNSNGKDVFTVLGTDDDLLNKRAALISKAVRTLALRVIPGDIQDEAELKIKEVRLNDAAQDPAAERKRLADAFAELNVSVEMLVEYLGHGLANCSPAELVKLRGVYGAIRDGELTWGEITTNGAPPPKDDKKDKDKTDEKSDTKPGPKTLDLTATAKVEGEVTGETTDKETGEVKGIEGDLPAATARRRAPPSVE